MLQDIKKGVKEMKKKNLISLGILSAMLLFGCFACPTPADAENNADNYIEQSEHMNVNMEFYIRKARRNVKGKWYPPSASFEKEATVVLTIDRQGQLVECKITQSSNDAAFDESIIKAAKEAKFEPLPKEFPYDKANIELSFGMQRRSVSK